MFLVYCPFHPTISRTGPILVPVCSVHVAQPIGTVTLRLLFDDVPVIRQFLYDHRASPKV
jgi:hypothetical protein